MADRKIAGTCFLKLDGTQFALRGNWSVDPTDRERTGVAGQDAVHGYSETVVVPYMEGDITDLAALSLKELAGKTDFTATLELANGKVYVGREGWVAGRQALNTTEGRVPLRLEFISIEEMMP